MPHAAAKATEAAAPEATEAATTASTRCPAGTPTCGYACGRSQQIVAMAWVVLIEFPDMDALTTWYNAPEYQPLIALRKECTSDLDMLITVEGA